MERFRKALTEIGKIIAIVSASFAVAAGAGKVASWVLNRADAREVAANRSEIAVLKSQRVDDSGKTDYILKRVDAIGDQLNNLALTGRVNYVPPPPALPEALAPVAAPRKGNAP